MIVHFPIFSDVIDDLIEAKADKVAEHYLDDGAKPGQGKTGGYSHDGSLADGRGKHPVGEVGT
jgi:hypothetical protein